MAAPRCGLCVAGAVGVARGVLAAMAVVAAAGAFAQVPSPRAPLERQAPPSATSESARQILSRVRASVVQIKGFFGSNTAQAFHGTGFAVARGGIFLTNYHVVQEAEELEVRLSNNKTYSAKMLGADPDNDLAVIKIEAPTNELSVVPLGASKNLFVGQKVLAIGNWVWKGSTVSEPTGLRSKTPARAATSASQAGRCSSPIPGGKALMEQTTRDG